jgi:hypothetical protein
VKNLDKFLKKYAGTSTSALKKSAMKKGAEVKKTAMGLKGDAEEYLEELGERIGEGAGKLKADAIQKATKARSDVTKYTKKNPEEALKRTAAGAGAVGLGVGALGGYAARGDSKKKKRPY